jgi:hypothetical protein
LILFFATSSISAVGNKTETPEQTLTVNDSLSESHSPDRSRTFSQSLSDPTRSASQTFSGDPGSCSAEYSVYPLHTDSIPYSDIVGYPEDKIGDVFSFSDIPAVLVQSGGFSVGVRLQQGFFFPNVRLPIALKIFAKSSLLESVLVPAEQAVGLEGDFRSVESHGINDFWPNNPQYFRFSRSNSAFSLQVLPLNSYRIAVDEWIIINFYFNATAPLGCATKPVVIRISAFKPPFYLPILGGVALFVMISGIIAAATQRTIPTSHHATMIAMLAWMHFAQEDGTQLPLALSPLQLSFGTTKYRYVLGALFGNAGIIFLVFFGQHIAMYYVARRRGYDRSLAARAVLYPRLTSSVVMHFAGAILFCCGRNFGNQTSTSFIVTSLVLLFTGWVIVKTHRVNVSSTMLFQAEFVENEVPAAHPLLGGAKPGDYVADINDTFLQTMRSRLTLQPLGFWKSTDPANSFVQRYGMVMENYTPQAKYWMLIETIDIAVTTLLSVFDNYTAFLAFFQFFVTLLVKLALLIILIWKRPLLTGQSSMAMLANYGGQVIGYLALSIGSLRYEIRGPAEIVQGIGCTIALGGLLYDVLVHVTTGALQFYDLYKRDKDFDENEDDAGNTHLELTKNFRRAKTEAELEDIEREAKLNFWFEHYCLKMREAQAIAARNEESAAALILTSGATTTTTAAAATTNNNNTNNNNNQQQNQEISNLSITSAELEGDRDWIFGNADERQQELPHYQAMPLWSGLTFSEQTDFFRHLFRGDLDPVLRKEVEDGERQKAEEERRAAQFAMEEAEDAADRAGVEAEDLELLGGSAIKNSFFTETLGGGKKNSSSMKNSNQDDNNSSFSESNNNNSSRTTLNNNSNLGNGAFSSYYDSDGIFIDRYHPLYKQRKAEKKKQKQAIIQQRQQELQTQQRQSHMSAMKANNNNNRGIKNNNNDDDGEQDPLLANLLNKKPKTKEETLKEAAARYAEEQRKDPSNSVAARFVAQQNQLAAMKAAATGNAFVGRSAGALSREWSKIADRTETTKPVPYLTEGDFLAL